MIKTLCHFLFGTLRGRLIIGVAAVHALMMALFIADLTARQRAMLLDRQIEEATALSQALATSAAGWIAADDIAGLQELVDAQRRYPEILFVSLVNQAGRVLADTDNSRQGLYMLDLPREARQTVISRTPALVDVAAPAMIGGRRVGWARVGIGQKAAGEKLAEMTKSGVVYALAAILIGSVIAWFMGRWITRRLYAVQETIDAVRSGKRLARSSLVGTDEAAVMAREFNSMLDALAERDVDLRTSEERYRSLISKVQTAIVLHDGQGRILNSNPLAQELLGLSADLLLAESPIDLEWHFLREDGSVLPVAEYPISLVLSLRQPLRGQVIGISRPDRDHISWLLVNAEPEYDDAGEMALVIVSFVDITERKLAEEKLHRLNRELRAIGNCNQVLVRAEDEQTLLNDICRIICDEAGYCMAWVGYAENDDVKTIRPVAKAGAEDGYLEQAKLTWADTERGRGPSGIALRSGDSACIQDFTTAPQVVPWRDSALQRGYRSCIALPLKGESATAFGILTIYSSEPNAFTPDEKRLLEELAGDLAFGIGVLRSRIERKRAEEALYEAQQVFRTLVENSPDIIARYDRDCRRTYVNPTYLKVAEISQQELLARSPIQRSPLPAASAAVLENLLRRVLHSGVTEAVDVIWPMADNVNYWYNIYAFPEFDREGRVVSVMTVSRDITDRKRAEEALQAASAYNRSLIEASLDPLVTINSEGKITDVNTAAEWVTGYSRDELIGTDFCDYFSDPHKARDGYQRAFKEGEVKDYELEVRNRDGDLTPVIYNASVYRDRSGEVAGLFAAARDVSQRKKAEEKNLWLAAIVESSDDAIIGKSLDGIITSWNEGAEKIYGYKDSEAVGKPITLLVPPGRQDEVSLFLERIKRGGHVEHHETVRRKKDGRDINISLTISPIRNVEGRFIGASTIARDITERKRAEEELRKYREHLEDLVRDRTEELEKRTQQLETANIRLQEADRLKSVFLASMSHELRTPLNSIIGFTGIMLMGMSGDLSEEQKKQLMMVKNSANHLLGLINDVLDIAKIEAGRVTLSLEQFEIGEVVDSVIETVSPMAQAKGLELIREVPSGLVLTGDKRRVTQILMNITGNAVKFTEHGSVTISAGVSGDNNLQLRFTDTGVGIKEEEMKKLFSPFQQIDATLTKAYEGTGLGLYLCKRLVSLLGGDITASSTYGRGSEFTVVLPQAYGGPHEKDIGG